MHISTTEYFRYLAISLLIIAGLVTLVSWAFVRKTADRAARLWFAALAFQVSAGLVLFAMDSAWREWAYFLGTIVVGSALYLTLYSARLMLGKTQSAKPLAAFWLGHFAIYTGLFWLARQPELALMFVTTAAILIEVAIVATLRRLRHAEGLAATVLAEFAFGAAIVAGLARIAYFTTHAQLLRYAEFSIYIVVVLSLQTVTIIFCCFYYIGLSIQRAEARELEMQLEATQLRVRHRLAEEHAAKTQQLVAERDHMMILNSRFSTMSAISLVGGGVVHEIVQPLQAARSAVDILTLSKDLSAAEVKRYAADIQQLIDQISDIVESLRQLMREKTIDVREVDCAQLLRRIFPIFRSEARRRGLDATCTIAPAAAKQLVRVNPVMLERVMFNLAANAIEAFEGIGPNRPGIKSTLTVSADLTQSAARPSLVIRFIDTGAGIPEDTRHDEIFELLKSGKSDGTGFGLYMVKVFVESWNGTIRATPNDINGQGTIIEMVLPVVGTV
ncbi:MAG: hypothetical protein RLZZ84_8 [Pseudomonadota bacterium]|jgi:signal transduction histidine kinase